MHGYLRLPLAAALVAAMSAAHAGPVMADAVASPQAATTAACAPA